MRRSLKQIFLLLLVLPGLLFSSCQQGTPPPQAYGPLPSQRQVKWQELGMYSLIHFGLNTFTDKEWGYGDVSPDKFHPTDFDPYQIVSAAKAAGIKGIILVAKHHDGFCLWPTETTDYNISNSSWKDGKGDVVKAFQEACKKQDMKFGVYCSPWDRNSAYYGTEKYVELYRNQLKELYSGYGDLFECWFDGANGGDGYYGGAKETRKINKATYYGWDTTWNMVRKMQPKAVIYSGAGRDVHWIGNERGYASDSTWETFTPEGIDGKPTPGNVKREKMPHGTRNGKYWMPAECDVPLRRGWFWHAGQKPKSVQQLFDIYVHSVGRSCNLDLGLAPDTTGQLSREDVEVLKKFGQVLRQTFSKNLAEKAAFQASNIRGDDNAKFGPAYLIDGNRYSYWATDDSVHTPSLTLQFDTPQRFNIIRLRENIKLGQRITAVAIDLWKNGAWQELKKVYGIGANRLIKLPNDVTTKKVRLRIVDAPVCIALSDFGLYESPDLSKLTNE